MLTGKKPPAALQPVAWILSGFLYKLFTAAGTGDGDLSLAPGNPDSLAALGAVEITVLPIFHPVIYLQEFPVFLITLVRIPGETPADRPDHQAIAQGPENQIEGLQVNKYRQEACNQARAQNRHIQPVRAITTGHKAAIGC